MYENSALLSNRSVKCFQKSLQPLVMLFMMGGFCYILSTPYLWDDAEKPGQAYAIFAGFSAAVVFIVMMAAYFSPHNEGWAWKEEAHTNPTSYGLFGASDFNLNGDVEIDSEDFYSSDSSATELETVKYEIKFENLGF